MAKVQMIAAKTIDLTEIAIGVAFMDTVKMSVGRRWLIMDLADIVAEDVVDIVAEVVAEVVAEEVQEAVAEVVAEMVVQQDITP